MKVPENFINFKLFDCRELPVYEQPDLEKPVIETIYIDNIFKVDVSRIHWSLNEQCFYKALTPSGQIGYIRTDCVKPIL